MVLSELDTVTDLAEYLDKKSGNVSVQDYSPPQMARKTSLPTT